MLKTDKKYIWRSRDNRSAYHQFEEGVTDRKSRCGLIKYPVEGRDGPILFNYQYCQSCLKMSQGISGNHFNRKK